jgi:hypothetical protein
VRAGVPEERHRRDQLPRAGAIERKNQINKSFLLLFFKKEALPSLRMSRQDSAPFLKKSSKKLLSI